MNQKRAKLIRKLTGFKVHKPRTYRVYEIKGEKGVRGRIIESDGDRAEYLLAKKNYLAKLTNKVSK